MKKDMLCKREDLNTKLAQMFEQPTPGYRKRNNVEQSFLLLKDKAQGQLSHLYTWVERSNVEQYVLSEGTTRQPRLGLEPPTFMSKEWLVNL